MRQQRAAWTMDISSCVQRQEEFVTTGQLIRGSAAVVLSLVISAVKSCIIVACIMLFLVSIPSLDSSELYLTITTMLMVMMLLIMMTVVMMVMIVSGIASRKAL